MSEFEKWFRSLNANGKTVYFLGNEHKVSEMAWNHQQAIIDDLKAQLNNMEACYIGKKKINDEQSAIIQGHFAARQDMPMKKGDRVKVDFISESRTIYSGKRFTGYGVLDRVEDGRVYGRLDDGTPFMCLCADVEVIER